MTLYLRASLSFSDKSINCYKSRGAFCTHEIIKVSNAQQAVFRVVMVLVHFGNPWNQEHMKYSPPICTIVNVSISRNLGLTGRAGGN